MSKEIELGQACFGNPTGDYGTEPFVDALVDGLLNEIERVFWNKNQAEWDRHEDPKIKGLEFKPYFWGNEEDPKDQIEMAKPNLKLVFSPQEVRWYKHPGRGQSCKLKWTAEEWKNWFEKGLEIINKSDKRL